jgi:hypothetical protein
MRGLRDEGFHYLVTRRGASSKMPEDRPEQGYRREERQQSIEKRLRLIEGETYITADLLNRGLPTGRLFRSHLVLRAESPPFVQPDTTRFQY